MLKFELFKGDLIGFDPLADWGFFLFGVLVQDAV